MKRIDLNIDDLIREHRSGKTPKELAGMFHVGKTTVIRRLAAAGATINMQRRDDIPLDAARALFDSGVGVAGVAKRLGCSPDLLKRMFRDAGIATRDRSAQQQARMDNSTPEQRKALAAAANASIRGVPAKLERLEKMARTCEAKGSRGQSVYERLFEEMLVARGVDFIRQKAIGKYNTDFAIGPVAVEIFGGKYHWHGDHSARTEVRFRDIMNRGWNILAIAVSESSPLSPAVADYVVAYIEEARRNPAAPRQYRVIWRAGEFSTGGGPDDDHISIEPPFTNTRNVASGRYERIPR